MFFYKELRLGALPTLQKAIGSDLVVNPTLLGVAAKPGQKHFQKGPTTLGPTVHQDSKHFKTGLGLDVQPDSLTWI
jgi:hypothetical protein